MICVVRSSHLKMTCHMFTITWIINGIDGTR